MQRHNQKPVSRTKQKLRKSPRSQHLSTHSSSVRSHSVTNTLLNNHTTSHPSHQAPRSRPSASTQTRRLLRQNGLSSKSTTGPSVTSRRCFTSQISLSDTAPQQSMFSQLPAGDMYGKVRHYGGIYHYYIDNTPFYLINLL